MTAQRRPARELLTRESEHLLATVFAGQVRAVVIERALKRMAAADARQRRAEGGRR
ncbi:hypothetical protein [Streptomyces sp. PD-S100-1]|uniref:hypothetical protein n=1 Tax=Streptomyces sp. PD-S100-1 TaxID=3394351 RepID=UPI0039BD0561